MYRYLFTLDFMKKLIACFLLCFFILVGCQSLDNKTKNYNSNPPHNFFNAHNVKRGDHIGGWTVSVIAPFSSSFPLSPDNLRILFKGKETIKGTYHNYSKGAGILQNIVCMDHIDEPSLHKLPRMIEDDRTPWFCFSNRGLSKVEFSPSGSSGIAEVEIKNYEYVYFPSEVGNTAELTKVISKNIDYSLSNRQSDAFIQKVISQMPKGYVQMVGHYPDRPMAFYVVETLLFKPCVAKEEADLECRTSLQLWSEKDDSSLKNYLQKNPPFNTYENSFGKKLIINSDTKNGIPEYASTDWKPGFGMGGETSLEKEYVFYFPDRSITRAVVSFWPYDPENKFQEKPLPEIQKVLNNYYKILTPQESMQEV